MKEEFEDLKIAEKTIYKRHKKLRDLGIIKNIERPPFLK